jgi:hypothetical protein
MSKNEYRKPSNLFCISTIISVSLFRICYSHIRISSNLQGNLTIINVLWRTRIHLDSQRAPIPFWHKIRAKSFIIQMISQIYNLLLTGINADFCQNLLENKMDFCTIMYSVNTPTNILHVKFLNDIYILETYLNMWLIWLETKTYKMS